MGRRDFHMKLYYRKCPDLIKKMFGNQFDLDYGGWIAGGAARYLWLNELSPLMSSTMNNNHQHDIDIWSRTPEQYNKITSYIHYELIQRKLIIFDQHEMTCGQPIHKLNDFTITCYDSDIYQSNNAISYFNCQHAENYYIVQIIRKPVDSLETLFNSFDIVNCQFATDGEWVVCTHEALDAWQDNKLVMNRNSPSPLKLARMVKYISHGLTVDKELWNNITQAALTARTTGICDDDYGE